MAHASPTCSRGFPPSSVKSLHMNVLIISDLHLTHRPNERKYNFLEKIISSADKVILNGDLWDSYLTSFDRFVDSDWNRLFPLLKSKKTVYLFGNHDPKSKSDRRVNRFSDIASDNFRLKIGTQHYFVTHGHEIDKSLDMLYPRLIGNSLVIAIHEIRNHIGVKLRREQFFFKNSNDKMKHWSAEHLNEEILVTGHTHLAEIDLSSRYINTGVVHYGLGQYLIISEEEVELRLERY